MTSVNTNDGEQIVITLGGFTITVLGRQFPSATDYWDGNWLNVAAECSAKGARVFVQGPIVHLREIKALGRALHAITDNGSKLETIEFLEPELGLKLLVGSRGNIDFEVSITPDNLNQYHQFNFQVDLSYLPSVIGQCNAILQKYEIIDQRD